MTAYDTPSSGPLATQVTTEKPFIAVRDLHYAYNKHEGDVLHGINLNVSAGVIMGLAGPDGAGKTTLMRVMAGLLGAARGEVQVAGFNPLTQAASLHWRVGYMPQKFGLYEDLSVLENLTLYADLRNVTSQKRAAQFKDLLQLTGLSPFINRMAGRLSGGMKQKLGLACALLGEPKILLLDEPGVGVDPISRRELWRMVRTLASQGMTVVWATAYLDEAQQCDSLCLLNEGKVIFSGVPQQAINAMTGRSLHVRDIDGNRRHVLQRALKLPQVMDGVIQGSSVRLVVREAGKWPNVAQLDAGPKAHLVEVAPRLEDMFIATLGGISSDGSTLAQHMPQVDLPSGVDADAVIAVENLTRRFGDFTATDHVTFKVRKGEIFGLIGPNGAGKSTTFKMLCGLLPISDGKASVMGVNLRHQAIEVRQQLGYMAQKFSLYGSLSVEQNLSFFSGIYGLRGMRRKTRMAEMAQCFGLKPYLKTISGSLSLGFKQRLALACALMHEPALLFLDEPTSGVDPRTRREFWGHINGLVDKGVTVLVTTHFMDEAEYCDRMALIYRGKAIAVGSPDELKHSVANSTLPDPTMEDAFVKLIERSDAQNQHETDIGARA